ncbi:hypothetical protein [Vulcaniibacterium gelatinicum]|uniref:hypothetical protein n=1 Tax=Vulcaniibacterium gelatinicum TaxID=2598725 RepID=UPI0011CB1359|nr:hypothetical protein [Vulcaniibacterium gelatinicum]
MRLTILSCALVLAACSRPEPPPTDQPPEPQAESHTELRDAIQQPLDKARAVEQTVEDAAEKQREEIDAQTGGVSVAPVN